MAACVNALLHLSHLYGFSPECVRMCVLSVLGLAYVLSHTRHLFTLLLSDTDEEDEDDCWLPLPLLLLLPLLLTLELLLLPLAVALMRFEMPFDEDEEDDEEDEDDDEGVEESGKVTPASNKMYG